MGRDDNPLTPLAVELVMLASRYDLSYGQLHEQAFAQRHIKPSIKEAFAFEAQSSDRLLHQSAGEHIRSSVLADPQAIPHFQQAICHYAQLLGPDLVREALVDFLSLLVLGDKVTVEFSLKPISAKLFGQNVKASDKETALLYERQKNALLLAHLKTVETRIQEHRKMQTDDHGECLHTACVERIQWLESWMNEPESSGPTSFSPFSSDIQKQQLLGRNTYLDGVIHFVEIAPDGDVWLAVLGDGVEGFSGSGNTVAEALRHLADDLDGGNNG